MFDSVLNTHLEFTTQQKLCKRINFRKSSTIHSSAQKMKFSIKDLVTFIAEILNGKLYFLRSASYIRVKRSQGISSKIFKTKWIFIFISTYIYPHTHSILGIFDDLHPYGSMHPLKEPSGDNLRYKNPSGWLCFHVPTQILLKRAVW